MAKLSVLKPRIPTADTRIAPPPPKQREDHYGTPEHKLWASKVVARANGQCQDPEHRGERRGHRLVADHIIERRDRPDLALDLANGMARCWSCHTRKTAAERARRARG